VQSLRAGDDWEGKIQNALKPPGTSSWWTTARLSD
jgi:hypothetical protein